MKIQINGEPREFSHDSLRLSELVEQLALAPQRIAVEVNRQIVRRADWEQTEVSDGDKVEIVHFVGGGEDHSEVAAGKPPETFSLVQHQVYSRSRIHNGEISIHVYSSSRTN